MAETETTNKFVLLGGLSAALTAVKNFFIATSGKIKASLLPLGDGFSVDETTGNVSVDSSKIKIDASQVDLKTATAANAGIVKIGDNINLADDGTISVTFPETDLSAYSTTTEVESIAETKAKAAVDAVVNGAPEAMDTLKEIADYLTDNTVADGLVKQLGAKANADDVYTKTTADDTFVAATDLDTKVQTYLTANTATSDEVTAAIAAIFAPEAA